MVGKLGERLGEGEENHNSYHGFMRFAYLPSDFIL